MTQLRINDETIEAHDGHSVLELARRHGSHIWFVCDGRGLCQTCECRVLDGEDGLSAPTDLECRVLSEERRAAGYRLACQTRLAGSGTVSLVSRAEELRRSARDAVIPGAATSIVDGMRKLFDDSVRAALDVLGTVPVITTEIAGRVTGDPPTPTRVLNYLWDTARVAGRLVTGGVRR